MRTAPNEYALSCDFLSEPIPIGSYDHDKNLAATEIIVQGHIILSDRCKELHHCLLAVLQGPAWAYVSLMQVWDSGIKHILYAQHTGTLTLFVKYPLKGSQLASG